MLVVVVGRMMMMVVVLLEVLDLVVLAGVCAWDRSTGEYVKSGSFSRPHARIA